MHSSSSCKEGKEMKKKRIILLIVLIIIFLNIFASYSNAASIWETAQQWLNLGQQTDSVGQAGQKTIEEVAGLLYGLGIVVTVVAAAILGINFITASSSDQKAEVKKKAVILVAGMVVLFGAVTIWQILVKNLSSYS